MVVNYATSKAGADTVVGAIAAAGGKAVAVRGDVSKPAGAQGIIDAAIANYGRLDILVNNSGIYEFGAIESVAEEQFHKTFNVNVSADPHYPGGPPAPRRRRQHHQHWFRREPPPAPAYSAVHRLEGRPRRHHRRALPRARLPQDRVNTIRAWSRRRHRHGWLHRLRSGEVLVSQAPLGRTGKVGDIAPIAVFLASDDSACSPGNNCSPRAAFANSTATRTDRRRPVCLRPFRCSLTHIPLPD